MYIGTAGVPIGCKNCSSLDALKFLKDANLNALELEFVRGVKMGEENAKRIKNRAEDLDIRISSHAPYYINLASDDPQKLQRSLEHIKKSLYITNLAGGHITAIHMGYYQNLGKEETYRRMKNALESLVEFIEQHNIKTKMGPETAGKLSQFGRLQEILRLAEEVPYTEPVFDIAHLHATREYDFTKKDEYYRFFNDAPMDHYHFHFSEINYGEKGERNHLNVGETLEPNYKYFLEVLKELGIKATIVLETPDLEESAKKLLEYWKTL
ncbi:MAG: TIM barrel protein [Candidatus Micrarchaeota archaeon]|nr:TIM barrel protein [Candidatus Micrarchaeota archaeon]